MAVFFWDLTEDYSLKRVPHTALRNCSKKERGEVSINTVWDREHMWSNIYLNNRSLPVVLDSISVNDFSAFVSLERYKSP